MTQARKRPPFKVRFHQGWQLATSSWAIFRSDKELASFPALSFLCTLVLAIPFIVVLVFNHSDIHQAAGQHYYTGWAFVAWVLFLLFATIVSNFFSAAVLYGAMKRFEGGNPTFRGSLSAASRKMWPIILFSLVMGTIGIVFQLIIERLPFAAKVVAAIAGLGWAIANFFSLPVIMFSNEPVMPLRATKRSAALIKKTWGESVVASGSIGIVMALVMFGFIFIWLIVLAFFASFSVDQQYFVGISIIGFLGFIAVIVLSGVLSGIVKAALYYYATTGQTPHFFEPGALQDALILKPTPVRNLFTR